MRCFFMKNGRICGVEYLAAKEDDALIAEAHEAFKVKGAAQSAQGFEVWDGARFVYRFEATGAFETREEPGPRTWLDRLFDLSKLKRGPLTASYLPVPIALHRSWCEALPAMQQGLGQAAA